MRFASTMLACALTLTLGLPWALAGDVKVSPKARKLFEAGVALLEDKSGPRYEAAYRAFKSAYEDSPSPAILGNLALCALELERDGEAIEAYQRYLAEADDISKDEREQVQKDIKTLEAGSAELTVDLGGEGFTLIDERVPTRGPKVRNQYGPFEGATAKIRVRAGIHRLTVKPPEGPPREISVTLRPMESRQVKTEVEPPEDPPEPDEPKTPSLPIPYVARPLTLPALTLSPAVRLRVTRELEDGEKIATVGLDLVSMKAGIIEDLELDVWAVPIELEPRVDYGTATAQLTYRFVNSVVELGSSLRMGHLLLPGRDRRFLVDPQVLRMLAHAGDMVRVDSAFAIPFVINSNRAIIGMRIPLEVAIQPVDIFHVGISTGFGIFDFEEASESSYIPVGAFIGGTIPLDERPLLDIGLRFAYPEMFRPGRADDKFEQRRFGGSLTFRLFFSL